MHNTSLSISRYGYVIKVEKCTFTPIIVFHSEASTVKQVPKKFQLDLLQSLHSIRL